MVSAIDNSAEQKKKVLEILASGCFISWEHLTLMHTPLGASIIFDLQWGTEAADFMLNFGSMKEAIEFVSYNFVEFV